MRRSLRFAGLALCLVLGSFGFAQTCVRTDILVQGEAYIQAASTVMQTVVGFFYPADGSPELAFRWNNGVFNTYQYPGATATQFAASNDRARSLAPISRVTGATAYNTVCCL